MIDTFYNDLAAKISSDYATYFSGKIIVALNLIFYRREREIKNIEMRDCLVESGKTLIEKVLKNEVILSLAERMGIEVGVYQAIQVAYPFISEKFLPAYPPLSLQSKMPDRIVSS